MFQKEVRRFQAFGVEGELYADKHSFTYATTLLDNADVKPSFGKAFTYADNPYDGGGTIAPTAAKIGGDGVFAGILVFPKEHALVGGLNASMEVEQGKTGALLNLGQVIVKPQSEVKVGYSAAYSVADGKIYGYPANTVLAGKASSGSIKIVTVTADTTVTIGTQVYTFAATPAAANEVKIGATKAESASNLATAIIAGEGAGTIYGAGTKANAKAQAFATDDVVNVIAIETGKVGDGIQIQSSVEGNTVVVMSGGADSTIPAGQVVIPHGKFVVVGSAADNLAVLQLGD